MTQTQTNTLPNFSNIQLDTVEATLKNLLAQNKSTLEKLLTQSKTYSWDNLLRPLEEMGDALDHFWSPIKHLHSVANSEALREVYKACLPTLSEYGMEIHQNATLYQAIQSIADSDTFRQLDIAQQKVIDHMLRDFRLAGVHLDPEPKQRFADLNKQHTQLAAQFEENLLDATQGWTHLITEENELAGLPEHAIAAAKQSATQKKLTGWLFTLEAPSYFAVLTYADSRDLREAIYRAFVTRASDQGPNAGKWDNSAVMNAIMQVRTEMAHLLGFNNFAEYALADRMAKTTPEVIQFLDDLVHAALPQAHTEFAALQKFAQEKYGIKILLAWDVPYYSEKLRQQEYAVKKEDYRPYFPEDEVLKGLFAVIRKLYGMQVEEIAGADVWKETVRLFAIYDEHGTLRGQFYLDLYARENKRDGAWMDDCRSRRKLANGDIQTPIAFLTCNFSAPVGKDPALFTHDDVTTLFHEFGHGLQHMLTTVDYMDVAGIHGIPWDAVEVASQFMESWCWEKEGLELFARHYQTGAHLPDDLFQKLIKAKNFQSAMQMIRQLQFALFDFRIHLEFDPKQQNQIQKILDTIRQQLFIFPTPEFNRFQHSFGHIFAGGYAAGYYSYKWAEVLACDAFSKFEENGIFDRATGDAFLHTILEKGGAEEPMDVFIQFRGRPPTIDALLRHNGISI